MITLPLSKSSWVARCAARLESHHIGISSSEAAIHADELWRNVSSDTTPEAAADMAVGSIEAIEHLFCHG